MLKVRWVVSNWFCSKFHTLSSNAKILKIVKIRYSYRQFKCGNFLETQCVLQFSMKIVALLQMFAMHVFACCLHALKVEFRVNFSTALASALCRVTAQTYSMFFWGRAFVKWFALYYRTIVCPGWQYLSVSGVGALWLNDWMDQDETGYESRHRLRPHCVRWGPSPKRRKEKPWHSAPHNYALSQATLC